MATVSLLARAPWRTRVRKSATGSVMDMPPSLLPARLGHAGDEALVCQLAQADPAHTELAEHRARAATPATPGVVARLVLLRAAGPHPLGRLRHLALFRLGLLVRRLLHRGTLVGVGVLLLELLERGLLGLGPGTRLLLAPFLLGRVGLDRRRAGAALLRERHAERLEQRERLLVGARGRRDGHVEPPHLVDRVVVDLGEDDLLADAHRVVAAAVERARVEAAEVANPRNRDRHQPIEELVGALLAQGDADAPRSCGGELEVRARFPGAADVGPLAGDGRELVGRRVEHVRVLLGVADTHVQGDLLDAGRLHRRGVAELPDQPLAQLLVVALLEPGRGRHQSITVPDRRATRLRSPSSIVSPIRVGLPSFGSTSATLDT